MPDPFDPNQIQPLLDAIQLRQILFKRRKPPNLSNTRQWRSYNAAVTCAYRLMDQTPIAHRAFITITTRCKTKRRTKVANRVLSRIVEKVLRPYTTGLVRFFHRTINGYIHLHILAALGEPILPPGGDLGSRSRRGMPWLSGFDNQWSKEILTPIAATIERQLSRACSAAGIGYKVEVAAVRDAEDAVPYCARYLRGIAESGRRYPSDAKVRLWAASKTAKCAKASDYIWTSFGRLQRMKLAAYAALCGCDSWEEARAKLGTKWAYYAREYLSQTRLRTYPCEEDFRNEWRSDYAPEALRIRILDPEYSPARRKFFYGFEMVAAGDRGRVAELLADALDVPESVWPHPPLRGSAVA